MSSTRPGWWADVCAHPDGLGFAWCAGPAISDCRDVVFEVNGREVESTRAPDTPRMLRVACDPDGQFAAVGQPQNGGGVLLYRTGIGWTTLLGVECYAMPAVVWDDTLGMVFYVQDTANSYVTVIGGVTSGPQATNQQQGIRQVVGGMPVYASQTFSTTIRGTTVLQYMTVQGIVCGQSPDQPYAVGIPEDVGEPFLALDAPPMDPRLAYSAAMDAYAVCSWTQAGQVVLNILPPFPSLPGAPEPPEPPVVPIVPIPPEPPIPPMPPIVPSPPHPPAVQTPIGVLLMVTPSITGLLQHYGIFKDGTQSCLRAESPSSSVCYSIQPDGTVETRPQPGGSYEFFGLDGQIASCRPVSGKTIYSFVIALVAGL